MFEIIDNFTLPEVTTAQARAAFPLAVAGAIVWALWLYRCILSARAKPILLDFSTSTSVIVPSYHEDPDILLECVHNWRSQEPTEIIIVLDVQDTEAFERISALADPIIHPVLFKHAGKRSALGVGIRMATSEILVLTDSDTRWEPELLANVQRPFLDPTVGAVSTQQNVYQRRTSVWRRIADWMVNLRYYNYVPAMGAVGAVPCVSGRTAAYRRSAVMPVLDNLENEFFLQDNAPAGTDVELAWNPEFLREGFAIEDTLRPDRLVFGVASAWAQEQLAQTYAPLLADGVPVVTTDLATAELVKVAANSFLATKISYINAMAEVCEATGADVEDLARALSFDSRIGGRFLRPGLGFGGGCLPKDIRAFVHRAEELGVGKSVAFLRQVDAINQRRRARTVDLVREQAGGDLTGVRVCCLGAAFKPNSDDIRDAPALDVARMLQEEGASVVVYDPEAMANARRAYPDLDYAGGVMEAAHGARVVVLLTEWDVFREIDPEALGVEVSTRSVVDGRHALDPTTWAAAGWDYRALGRAS